MVDGFLYGMLETPGAWTRLVWCDWLEDRGDVNAWHYRECTEFIEETNELRSTIPKDLAIIWNVHKEKLILIEVYYNGLIYTVRNVPGRRSNLYWLVNDTVSSERPKKISESMVPLIVQVAAKYAIMDEEWPSIRHKNPCREIPVDILPRDAYTIHEEDDDLVEEQAFYDPTLGEPYEQEEPESKEPF